MKIPKLSGVLYAHAVIYGVLLGLLMFSIQTIWHSLHWPPSIGEAIDVLGFTIAIPCIIIMIPVSHVVIINHK